MSGGSAHEGPAFLKGGGDAGAQMRALDWTSTPLGPPELWPQSLRTAVQLMLNSGHPISVFWGAQATYLFNDAFGRSIGAERRAAAMAQPGRQVWSEIWSDVISPQIEQVMGGAGATWRENQLVPILRDGRLDHVYWTYSYSPIGDDAAPNGVGGVLVLATETTDAVMAEQRRREEAERQRRIFEQAPGFIHVMRGPTHDVEFVNAEHRRLFASHDWVDKPIRAVFPDLEGQGFFEVLDKVYSSSQAYKAHEAAVTYRQPDTGEEKTRYLDFIYAPLFDDEGLVNGIFCQGFDVTDRVEAELELRTAEKQLRLATETAEIGWWDVDEVEERLFWPPRVKAMFGISADKPATMADFYNGLHPDDRSRVGAAYAAAADPSRRALYDVEYRTQGKEDGVQRWVAAKGRGVFDQQGRCVRVIGTALDITERKVAQERLRQSEADLAETAGALDALISNAPIGFAFFDRSHRYVRVNQVLADINGVALEAHIGRALRDVAGVNADAIGAMIDAVFATGRPTADLEVDGSTPAHPGETRSWLISFFPASRIDDAVSHVGVAVIDITERRRAEAAVRDVNEALERRVHARTAELFESERRFRAIFDTTFQVTGLATLEGAVIVANRAALDALGLEQSQISDLKIWETPWCRDLPHEADKLQSGVARAAGGEFVRYEAEYRLARGMRTFDFSIKPVLSTAGKPIFLVVEGRDITDQKHAEERLRHAQKIEAVGQLTGGVAHDFNNLLMVITGGLSLLGKPQSAEKRQRILDGMRQAAVRGATLSRQLLTFSRRQSLKPQSVDLVRQVEGMREILDRTLRGDVHVEGRFADDLWPVSVDTTELELVVLNLCVNARDAMPKGGTIMISAENIAGFDDGDLQGDFVRLSVADTGGGIAPEVLQRVFEPFFTTKEIGKGSGLGLAQVHGFVTQSGGKVDVQSVVGSGTTVALLLPRSHERPVLAASPSADLVAAAKPESAGRILLVEDDAEVGALVCEMLTDLRYEVVRAWSAQAALGAVADGRPLDVVFSDIMMPGDMDGIDLANEIRRRRPDLPVLLTSGFAKTLDDHCTPAGVEVLPKPYQLQDLEQALNRVRRRDS